MKSSGIEQNFCILYIFVQTTSKGKVVTFANVTEQWREMLEILSYHFFLSIDHAGDAVWTGILRTVIECVDDLAGERKEMQERDARKRCKKQMEKRGRSLHSLSSQRMKESGT